MTKAYSGTANLETMREAVRYNAYLIDLVRRHAPANSRILDFGAGDGTFAVPLTRLGHRVICVEPDAQLNAALERQGMHAVRALGDLKNGEFDYIYSLNVLEHIEDDAAALRELHGKLRAGGKLLLYVPAFQLLYSAMDRRVGHFRRYRRHHLMETLRNASFKVEVARYVDCLGFFATLAYRLIGDPEGGINPRQLRIYDCRILPFSLLLDGVAGRFFGKNLLVIASKP